MLAAGPPWCSCGRERLAMFKSDTMLSSWASREGISWSYTARGPYFHFCQPCHSETWAADIREPVGNRSTRPFTPSWRNQGAQWSLLMGHMCVRESPPEFCSSRAREQARRLPAARPSEAAAERGRRCRGLCNAPPQQPGGSILKLYFGYALGS